MQACHPKYWQKSWKLLQVLTKSNTSTDLNPAEHIWSILKSKLKQQNSWSKETMKRIISAERQNMSSQ